MGRGPRRTRRCNGAQRPALRPVGAGEGFGGFLEGLLGLGAAAPGQPEPGLRRSGGAPAPGGGGPTNQVVDEVNGILRKRLGSGDILVSEVGLGTQRWGSMDFNAPDQAKCHELLDLAVLDSGVNLVDTAEQYPIPSGPGKPEGRTEEIIGSWLAKEAGRRQKLVIASKITGGRNVNARNLRSDCEGSLRRLGTDYLDIYLLHWPARYTPQANWGQSLNYDYEAERSFSGFASFREVAQAMGELVAEGKIRGWGHCNDNAYGLAASCAAAREVGAPPPVAWQGDYSIINRRSEENGVFEACSPIHENVGFMSYNALAGGVLTGKYLQGPPPAPDDPDLERKRQTAARPRGRHDDSSWGRTLYRYRTGPADEATRAYAELASRYGLSLTELSLRWCRERRGCTTVLLGQSSMEQLREDLSYFRKRDHLPEELMWSIDCVHMRNRLPIFSSERVGQAWRGRGEIGERIP